MRLADYAASCVDKNTAVLSFCPGRTKTTLPSLSCCCALDAVIFAVTADYTDVHQRPSSAACLTSPLRYRLAVNCPRRSRDLSVIKAAGSHSSARTRLSGYTAIFVLFFFLSVSPDFALHSLYDSGSGSLLLRQVLDRG